jgi:phosphatidylglycerol:prolipoprotein diacylglycerol transferase
MIPYFELRTISLPGGIEIAAFGTLVALGVFAGVLFAERRARAAGVREHDLYAAIAWVVVPGFVAAHLVSLLGRLGAGFRLSHLLEFWNGMSSFGGFFGALAGLLVWSRTRPAPLRLAVAEVLTQALVVGWVFGRLGCTLVHDHIGRPSEFLLAIRFPGGPRHDLGLYELLFTVLVLVPAIVVLNRRPRPAGATIATVALLYAPARFAAEFLRNTDLPDADARYLGLTVAQYGCIALAAVGIAFARRASAARAPARERSAARVRSPS